MRERQQVAPKADTEAAKPQEVRSSPAQDDRTPLIRPRLNLMVKSVGDPPSPPLVMGGASVTVQRQKNDFAVEMRDGQAVVAGRPDRVFTSSMGNHVTAFKLHRDAVEHALSHSTPKASARALLTLTAKVGEHSALKYVNNLSSDHKKKLEDTQKSLLKYRQALGNELGRDSDFGDSHISVMQEMSKLYLEYRELLPAATLNTGSNGNQGEQSATPLHMIDENTSEKTALGSLEYLLDPEAAHSVYNSKDANALADAAPGFVMKGPNDIPIPIPSEDRALQMARNHYESIIDSNPEAISAAFGKKATEDEVVDHFASIIRSGKRTQKTSGFMQIGNQERDRFATSIKMKNGKISEFSVGGRPLSSLLNPREEGSHTTAWAVNVELVRKALLNATPDKARENLLGLVEHYKRQHTRSEFLEGLFGAGLNAPDIPKESDIRSLQKGARTVLTSLNRMKGAALEAAVNNSRNESQHLNIIREAQKKPRNFSKKKVGVALNGLIDISGLDKVTTPLMKPSDKYGTILPFNSNSYNKNAVILFSNHVSSMEELLPNSSNSLRKSIFKEKRGESELKTILEGGIPYIDMHSKKTDLDNIHELAGRIFSSQVHGKVNSDEGDFSMNVKVESKERPSRKGKRISYVNDSDIESESEYTREKNRSQSRESHRRNRNKAKNSASSKHYTNKMTSKERDREKSRKNFSIDKKSYQSIGKRNGKKKNHDRSRSRSGSGSGSESETRKRR